MDVSQLLKSTRAFQDKLQARENEQIVEILEAHGQKCIVIHPSEIFPFHALLHYSLVDGKPRVEVTSEEGGPHAKSGVPNLRIDVNDGAAWEDEERWPHIPNFEAGPDEIELDVRYISPDRTRLARMWRMCVDRPADSPRPNLIIAYMDPNTSMHALDVYGFGSKFGGRRDDGEHVADIHIEQVVAAMLVGGE